MHFESKQDYITWATTILFSTSDKANSNAIGNAFDHANKLANLFWPQNTAAPALPPGTEFRQPPAVANKAPPVPGERAMPTEASGANG